VLTFLFSSEPLGAGVRSLSGPSWGLGPAVRALECMCFETLPLAEGQRGPCVKLTLFSIGQGLLHGWVVHTPEPRLLWPCAFCGLARPVPCFDCSRVMRGSPLLRVVPGSPSLPQTTLRLGERLRRCGLGGGGFSGFPAAAALPGTLLSVTGPKL
jgi:hypothetical protein